MKALGFIFQFLSFVIGLFRKDSDDHLKDAYKKVEKQDETIADLEEDINYQKLEHEIKNAEEDANSEDAQENIEDFYKNRGK